MFSFFNSFGSPYGKTEIVNNETKDKIFTNISPFIKGYTQRDDKTDWARLFAEFATGKGPEKSLMYGLNQKMNRDIIASSIYIKALTTFLATKRDKDLIKPGFGPIGAASSGTNMSAQFLGKANYNFYKVGNKIISIITDSKSKTSWSLNPFAKDEIFNTPRSKGKITQLGNTFQTYIFILPFN